VYIGERDQEIRHFPRQGQQLEDDLRDHRQCPFRSDYKMGKVVPRGVFPAFPSEPCHRSVCEDRLKGEDRIPRGSVLHHLVAAGVLGHVAPYEGSVSAAGISRVQQAFLLGRLCYLRRNHARLNCDGEVFPVQFKNPAHFLKREDDSARKGDRTAGQPSPGSSRRDRYNMFIGVLHDCGHMFRRLREDHGLRDIVPVPVKTGNFVIGVGDPLLQVDGDIRSPEHFSQVPYHLLRHGRIVRAHAFTPSFLRRSMSLGTISKRSPQSPRSATLKIGASGSRFIATMYPAVCIPARCCTAPEMPAAI